MDQLQAMSRSIFACDARMVLRPQNEIRMGQVFLNFFVLCCACATFAKRNSNGTGIYVISSSSSIS